jgi:hypothetical protein
MRPAWLRKVDHQGAILHTYNMNVGGNGLWLLLLANCSEETCSVTTHDLFLSIDYHLRGVYAVTMKPLPVGALSFRIGVGREWV